MTAIPRLFPNPGAPPHVHDPAAGLRAQVREFVAKERERGGIRRGRQSWPTWDRAFSERCAAAGYVAMTWPKNYGGHARTPFERYVVNEELLAAGAPLGSHWIADRQSGPQIMRNGSERAKQEILPKIAAGQCTFGIGMSEPDSGSDLSSIRTKAELTADGYVLNGRKIWTTNAQHAEYIIILCRTEAPSENRYAGMSQLILPMKQKGVSVRPLRNLADEYELNEITLDNAVVPADFLLGKGGDGWRLVTEELAFERSGPDRILSTFSILQVMTEVTKGDPDRYEAVEIGKLVAQMSAIRQLSLQINRMIARGEHANAFATIMKDLGSAMEQEIPDIARKMLDLRPSLDSDELSGALATAILNAPCFSLRGGTREILKGIIARELGLR